jgi:putative protease
VEGRSKTIYYLATVASVYRKAIDNMMAGRDYDPSLMKELEKTASRGYSPGFLKGTFTEDDIHYEKNEPIQTHKFIGVVRKHHGLKCEVEIRNRIEKGSEVEILTPEGTLKTKIDSIFDKDENEVNAAHGGAGEKIIKFDKEVPEGAFVRQKCANRNNG